MTARQPRQLLRRDERRAQILRAAAVAFSESGFAATSVEDVAKQAGITKLIVYRHFESKAELYRAILDEVARRLSEEFLELMGDVPGSAGVVALLNVARELPDGFRLLFLHAAREPEFAGFAREFRELQTLVAAGALEPMIADPTLRAWGTRQLVDTLVSAVLNWMECGDPARDHLFVELTTDAVRSSVMSWATVADEALRRL